MADLSDLLRPRTLDDRSDLPSVLLVGTVTDPGQPLRVMVPALDGGAHALSAAGYYPQADTGDSVWLKHDEFGGLVIVAWEPADEADDISDDSDQLADASDADPATIPPDEGNPGA